MGEGEDDVEIVDGQYLGEMSLQPAGLVEALAFGAMPVAAGVVGWTFESAEVAPFEVAAEGDGPAALDSSEDFQVKNRQRVGAEEVTSMQAYDVRQLPPGPFRIPLQVCRSMRMDHEKTSACLLGSWNCKQVERALYGAQFLARELEVALGGGNPPMAQEDLNGPQVNAGLEQMGRKGMPQRVNASDFCYAGSGFGLDEGPVWRSTMEGFLRGCAREKPMGWMVPPPVVPQMIEHLGGEEGEPVLVPLSLNDADHPPAGIYVTDLQADEFADAKACAVGGFEKDSVLEVLGSLDDPKDFVGTEDVRQAGFGFAWREGEGQGFPTQGDAIEESKAGDVGVAGAPGELLILGHEEDIILDLPVGDLIRGCHIPFGQAGHGMKINALGVVGEPPQAHVTDPQH